MAAMFFMISSGNSGQRLVFACDFGVEFFLVDDHAFVRAFGDAVNTVMGDHRKTKPPAVDVVERDIDGDGQSRRCCGEVRKIDQRAE